MILKKYLALIRYPNLLMIILMQIIVRYGFLKMQSIDLALNDLQFFIFVLATVFIAAAGYVINDIFDQEVDQINKPNKKIVGNFITENQAYNYYAVLNITGVACGFYVSNVINKPSFAAVFIVIAATLYIYASSLKQTILLGNLIIALLTALSVMLIAVFDLYPIVNQYNNAIIGTYFYLIIDYALFAFILTFIREIVKDLEDIDGDNELEINTLAVYFGIKKTKYFLTIISAISVISFLFYIQKYYFQSDLYLALFYDLILVISPLIYFTIKLTQAETKTHFSMLSNILKVIMFFGVLSILVVNYNILLNAK